MADRDRLSTGVVVRVRITRQVRKQPSVLPKQAVVNSHADQRGEDGLRRGVEVVLPLRIEWRPVAFDDEATIPRDEQAVQVRRPAGERAQAVAQFSRTHSLGLCARATRRVASCRSRECNNAGEREREEPHDDVSARSHHSTLDIGTRLARSAACQPRGPERPAGGLPLVVLRRANLLHEVS
jgi:hypothetical protein